MLTLALSWVQVSSDTYIVKSSAGEERAKRVLKELEGFHQLIGATLVFRNTELPELPIEVLLIGDQETLKELEPVYDRRKISVAGFYQAGQDRDFIVLSGLVFPETLTRIVYHELTHYFLARGLASAPTWLNEGLAEYFSTAEVRDDEISLGALSTDRLQLLRTSRMLALKEFFSVNTSSVHYNEDSKASVYYAQAWAFIHYLMHGEHAPRFKQYLTAMQKADANLLEYLGVNERTLESGFQNYLKTIPQRPARNVVKVSGEEWDTNIETIPDTDARMSIAEIFLANGKLPEARRHLEILSAQAPDSTRVSYYRGLLARITGDPAARDFFVDALLDPFLAPRAAVQLVHMGDAEIPSVRAILEEAAAMRTRTPEVYLALADIYAEDIKRIEEAVRLRLQNAADQAIGRPAPEIGRAEPVSNWTSYMGGSARNVGYELLSDAADRPRVAHVVVPYYPAELITQQIAGEVVLDVQITEEGKVAGIWLVSAMPDIFGNLATASVREWHFEPIPAKIRVVLKFHP